MIRRIGVHMIKFHTRNGVTRTIAKDLIGISKHSGVPCINVSTNSSNYAKAGLFEKIYSGLRWFDYSKATLRAGGFKLYENVADRVHHEEFFEVLGLPDTLYSWFLVVELHVWMVMARVMAEKDGRFVRNVIVGAMWEDIRMRMKRLEEDSASNIQKTLQELSQQFGAAIIGYDEGLLGDDRCLAGALWRRILQQKYGTAMSLEALVRYVRVQMYELEKLNREQVLLKPNLKWNPLMIKN